MKPNQEFSRVNRPVQAAESYYSRLSRVYDLLASSEKRFIRQGLDLLDPQPGEMILEVGFGTGYAQQRIAQAIGGGFSAGLDLSIGMGKVAQRRLFRSRLLEQVGLVQSDTLPIPFQNNIFDAVFSSFALELFDSPLIPEVLQECRRVLKPGGRIVIVSLSRDVPLPLMGRIYENLHISFPNILDCRPIPAQDLVEKNGFVIKKSIITSMWGLPVILLWALDLRGSRAKKQRVG